MVYVQIIPVFGVLAEVHLHIYLEVSPENPPGFPPGIFQVFVLDFH